MSLSLSCGFWATRHFLPGHDWGISEFLSIVLQDDMDIRFTLVSSGFCMWCSFSYLYFFARYGHNVIDVKVRGRQPSKRTRRRSNRTKICIGTRHRGESSFWIRLWKQRERSIGTGATIAKIEE
jgi:hypothetical protein